MPMTIPRLVATYTKESTIILRELTSHRPDRQAVMTPLIRQSTQIRLKLFNLALDKVAWAMVAWAMVYNACTVNKPIYHFIQFANVLQMFTNAYLS